jgi:hypothetical protein
VDFGPQLLPYVVLGVVVLIVFGAFSVIRLPRIEASNDGSSAQGTARSRPKPREDEAGGLFQLSAAGSRA